MRTARNRGAQRGTTLIETLIALVILAIGLLGVAGLQAATIHANYLAYQYTQATLMAQGIVENMRANRPGALAGGYRLVPGDPPPDADEDCRTQPCTPSALAASDLAHWYDRVAGGILPSGALSIICADAGCADGGLVTIYWDANRTGATGLGCDPESEGDLRCLRLAFVP